MAQRDYVKKKSKTKNPSRIIPNLMMAIAVILVVLFVAILYFVSTNKTSKQTAPTTVVTEKPQATLPDKQEERWTYLKELENPDGVNNSASTQTEQSSQQQKERQQILDSFVNENTQNTDSSNNSGNTQSTKTTSTNSQTATNKTVQSSTTQSSTVAAGQASSWLLQCGAFKDKANAESLKAKLAMTGITSFIKSDKFYRVLAGPYASKDEAEKTIAMLKTNGMTSCISVSK